MAAPITRIPQEYEKWNPVNHVDKWKTPMLVIHGEQDFRIPYTQGLAAFTALQRRDIPSRLLIFPDENHWVLKPRNTIQWYGEVFGWLDKWTKRGGERRRATDTSRHPGPSTPPSALRTTAAGTRRAGPCPSRPRPGLRRDDGLSFAARTLRLSASP